jgi:hypothetical protein
MTYEMSQLLALQPERQQEIQIFVQTQTETTCRFHTALPHTDCSALPHTDCSALPQTETNFLLSSVFCLIGQKEICLFTFCLVPKQLKHP